MLFFGLAFVLCSVVEEHFHSDFRLKLGHDSDDRQTHCDGSEHHERARKQFTPVRQRVNVPVPERGDRLE